MTETQLFFTIHQREVDTAWQENINFSLKKLPGISEVFIISKNENDDTQINLNFDPEKCSLGDIELMISGTGTSINAINIHFPSGISGVSDAYGASAVSLPLKTNLEKIRGVTGASISSSGIIKVELDPGSNSKNNTVKKILEIISLLRQGNL